MQLFRKKTRRELILFAVLNGVIGEGGKKMTEQEIIDQYSTVVRVLALARTQRTCDADDVYQEVFYRYIDKKPTFRDEEHARAWFIRVTMNVTKNMQSRFDNARRSDADEEKIEQMLSDDDFMEEVERRADFEELLNQLNPRYKAVLMLHFDCGYTAKEISRLLGKSEIAVKNLLAHGKQQYKKIMMERNSML